MTKKQQILLSALSVVVMLLLILLTRRVWFRLDLTANKAYTLSAASKKLRGEIGETVRLTYYLSDKLRSIDPAPAEIADFLREYEAGSGGAVQVAVKDPASSTGAAERYGLQPQQLQNVEADEASFSMVYSGIVIEYLNKAEILPWVFSFDTLEYNVTSRIRSLLSGKKRELGVLAPEAQRNWSEYYGFFNQVLSQSGFSVLPLSAADEIPDTLPALLVLGGAEELSGAALYRIDRYLQLGGRILFMEETVQVDLYGSWEARPKEDRGLLGMISWYGATLESGLVLDRAALPMPYQDPATGEMRLIRYAPWVGVLGENAGDHILTGAFGGADLFWASPITITAEAEKVKAEILFTSTDQAWLMTRDFVVRPEMSPLFNAEEEETRGKRILAVALEGRFPSWFAGQEKPAPEGGEWEGDEWRETATALPDMPDEAKEARIIVIGDADMGGALVQYTQTQSPLNFNFLLQAVDWLGNDDDIVGIRNRQTGTGRLDKIQDELARARAMNFSRVLNVFIVPLAILVFGVFRMMNRTKRIRGGRGGKNTPPKARDASAKEETGHAVS
ncbi:MAG: GldG family protein [Treponema sp.]|jgi:ABC-type uncharacterized transport system involved in gliding motility auxiliary subunit|nr:GldG family protein [Treponema sp.]